MLDFEYFLSFETQLNYKNGFERKNLLGNQFTFGPTAQATLIYVTESSFHFDFSHLIMACLEACHVTIKQVIYTWFFFFHPHLNAGQG
jgi:hypothetical protein